MSARRCVGLAMVLALLGACASGSTPGDEGPADVVEVAGFTYRPSRLTVKAGTLVRWINRDQILHTATASGQGDAARAFDGTMDGSGTSFTHRFDAPGIYAYACSRHEGMRGTVEVTQG